MAFLDNSGDIILDAVLTDTGRFRLAKGEFVIQSFALGDDEIDYSLYNKTHASGSSYYDLEILQTPVLEAFTNNASSLKSKLMSLPRNDHLYLPILKLNDASPQNTTSVTNNFLIAVNTDTENTAGSSRDDNGTLVTTVAGTIFGATTGQNHTVIKIDQGIDSTESGGPAAVLGDDLAETSYIIELDNRLGSIVSTGGDSAGINIAAGTKLSYSYIDDDNIASYIVDESTNQSFVEYITSTTSEGSVIAGQRGTRLTFSIAASLDVNSSTYLFTKLGGSSTYTYNSTACYYIDSTVRVIGVTTGYQLDIPIRYIRKV